MQDPYTENCKTLLREIKEDLNGEVCPVHKIQATLFL